MDFANNKINRVYQSLFENVYNDKLSLTRGQFRTGFTIFCVNLTLTLDANSDDYINKQNISGLRLELNFARAPTETLILLLLAKYECVMSINLHREITILDPNAIKTE